ncbi:MAG: hypothetical protein FWB90_08455 [Fibromonadales bacterium]|nr:hypothetical protein [Fibromonadales bacterium]
MARKTLSQKIFEIVGNDPDSFDEAKELQVKELLKPLNHEIDIKKVKWRPCKGNW